MDRFRIEGGRRLEGTVQISGAKNAALPCMAAALLTSETVHLQNIPHVRDIITMAKLLAYMRCRVESPDIPPSEFIIQAEKVSLREAPYELVKTMRASVLTLGPLLARFGYARVSLPGGCAIGARPIDIHIQALEKLGAYNKRIPMDVSPATASLFIVAPLSAGQVFTGLFSTHPPLEKRIEALREMTVVPKR